MSKFRVRRVFRPAVCYTASLLAKAGVKPNHVTLASLALALMASVSLSQGFPVLYGLLLFTSGFLDGVDGALARLTGEATPQGGLLDSLCDRYSDIIALSGFLFWKEGGYFKFVVPVWFWVTLAIAGFLMVSYVRVKGEALGVSLDVGFAARSERLLILSASSLLYPLLSQAPVIGLALTCVASHLTATYRFLVGAVKLKSNFPSI